MGTFEKNLLMYFLKFFFRWLASNEKNKEAKTELQNEKDEI